MTPLLLATALAVPPLAGGTTTAPPTTGDVAEAVSSCPAGYVAFSGGANIYGAVAGLAIDQDGPDGAPGVASTWWARVRRDPSASGTTWGVQGGVICLSAAAAGALVPASTRATMGAGSVMTSTAACPTGTRPIAGGTTLAGGQVERAIAGSAPRGAIGWRVSVVDTHPPTPEAQATDVTVTAWCMPDALYRRRVQLVTAVVPGGPTPSATAACPAGMWAVAGGGRVDPAIGGVVLTSNASNNPGGPADAWNVTAQELDTASLTPWTLTAFAVCLR